jgi:hypothetical protein
LPTAKNDDEKTDIGKDNAEIYEARL